MEDAAFDALEMLPLPCVLVDRSGHIRRINGAALSLLQLDARLASGKLLVTNVAVGSRRELRRLLLDRPEHARILVELQSATRQRVPVRLLASRVGGGGMLLVFVDRRRELGAESRAKQSELRADRLAAQIAAPAARSPDADDAGETWLSTRLGRLLQAIPQALVGVDEALRVTEANDAARELFGAGATVGRPLARTWHGFPLAEFVRSLTNADDALSAEAGVTMTDGRRVQLLAMVPADRRVAVILATDVSARDRRELAERDFVADAAHELQTPIAAIVGAVGALELGAKEEPQERDRFVRHVAREADRMQMIVRALLELARMQYRGDTPTLERVVLRDFLEHVRSRLAPADGVAVEVLCPDGLTLMTNRELLALAVGNAASNAARFTREGRIRLSALSVGGQVAVQIADSGPGIGAAERPLVLERFYPARPSSAGSGLGLSIVSRAVAALGGELELSEAREGGTLVRLTLPGSES